MLMKTPLTPRAGAVLTASVLSIAALLPAVIPVAQAAKHSKQQAQTQQRGSGLEIAPPVVDLKADPGQTVTAQVRIRNITQLPMVVNMQANDFVADGEGGEPKLLLKDDEKSPYSLKEWIQPVGTLSIAPQQLMTVPVRVRVPADASPGGHFGVVRFTPDVGAEKPGTIATSASVGTLILMRVSGDIKEKLEPMSLHVEKDGKRSLFFSSAPVTIVERVKNTGNVHQAPNGLVEVKDWKGTRVASLAFADGRSNILPDSVRQFKQEWKGPGLGMYKVSGYVNYGNGKKVALPSSTFWILPVVPVVAALAILLILIIFVTRFRISRK